MVKSKQSGHRNHELVTGVSAYSKATAYHKRGTWAVKNKKTTPSTKKERTAGKMPRFYPTERIQRPLPSRKTHNPTRLRASITPGTVLISLAGRHRGKRMVFLKQLKSGLLAVTGPFKLNGVPIRRVNQAYVIATSTKVDLAGVDRKGVTDEFFTRKHPAAETKGGDKFFGKGVAEKKIVDQAKKDLQKKVDAALLKNIKGDRDLAKYLSARFTLTNKTFPHAMKF